MLKLEDFEGHFGGASKGLKFQEFKKEARYRPQKIETREDKHERAQ